MQINDLELMRMTCTARKKKIRLLNNNIRLLQTVLILDTQVFEVSDCRELKAAHKEFKVSFTPQVSYIPK